MIRLFIVTLSFILLFVGNLTANGTEDFSEDEKTWLEKNIKVRVRIGVDPPLADFVNDEPQGIVSEYLKIITEKTGVQFEYVPDKIAWPELLQNLIDHKGIDILPLVRKSVEREEEIAFTDAYIQSPSVIFARDDNNVIIGVEDLQGFTTAVPDKWLVHDLLKKKYPTLRLKPVKNLEECLSILSSGQVDACACDLFQGTYQIRKNGLVNIKITGPITFETPAFSLGIRKDWPELVSIINKVLKQITIQQHNDIRAKWVNLNFNSKNKFGRTFYIGIGLIFLLVLIVVLWNFSLQKQITKRKKTESNLTKSETRFRRMIEKAPLPMVITDENQDISFLNNKFTELFGYTIQDVSTAEEWWKSAYPDEDYRTEVQHSWTVAIEKALANNTDIEMQEWDLTIKDRTKRCCEFYMVPSGDTSLIVMNDITEQKLGKERYKKTIELSFDGFWIINTKGEFIDVNEEYCHMIGYKKSDLLSMAIPDVDAGMSSEEVEEKIKTIMSIGSGRFETRQRHKNGKIIDVEISTSYIKDEGGKFFVFLRDITERKRKERVQKSQLRLVEYASFHSSTELLTKFLDEAEMLTSSKIGFYHFYDENRKLLSLQTWSTNTIHNMCTTEGSKAHYPIEKAGVWADCARDRKPVIHNNYESLPNKKGLPEGHAPIIRELVVPVIRDDNIVAILGVGNRENDYNESDINTVQELADLAWETVSRKLAEELLYKNEEKYRRLSENSPAVVYQLKMTFDGTFSFPYINASVKSIIGVAARDIIRNPSEFIAMIHPEDQEVFLEGVMKSGKSLELYHEVIRYLKDGEERWIEARSMPETMKDGSILWDGFLIDITEKKKAEEEMKKLELRLQQAQKMEAIGTLAGGIAHDFNNILSVILGFTDMAKDDCQPGSSISKDLDEVLEAANRAKDLVKQILAFSRQDGTDRISLEPASIVEESIKMLRPSLPTTIKISQKIDPQTGRIFADRTQIHQILMNLCTNAFHAMEETGGKLDISLREVVLSSEDLVHEPGVVAGAFIQLSIGDSGPGIAPAIKDKIFDPYFTTKEAGKGTGMGLSIIHGIVKSYGGFISLYSELGEGTIFHVFLPVVKKEELQENEIIDQIPTGCERILFVDDEEILAKMGKTILERLGYHVTVRHSSLKALEIFQNHPDQFDLVITDQTMPGMTGKDLSRRMLQIRPDIPIILCTGYSTIMSEQKAKSMGIKEFALKPLTKKDIARLTRKVLDAC